ncbi:DUF1311 domain-containing protein [Mesorhizobium sp. B3-1-7]|uniref:lysozyme inhibitor LprI family protein n=1 Tax=Mesorhizobium sp. B3-1-7 TaxID=2589894 RepID=UPI00112A99B5|nr:lysozyme inhibitor LprI family protein [Mesorhizobium sp. B3-1-7]TPI53357.1 DUF1311 domain-containing protein [Mesorhizobium sp. B3-1-7]
MAKSGIHQIIDWKDRRGPARIGFEVVSEAEQLRDRWHRKLKAEVEFSDFVPIRLVTIIEVFVREILREIVDYGQPYFDRAERFTRGGAKIDFDFLSNLQGKKISVGDLVGHSVSVNNPTQIISNFETVIPDFVTRLKVSHARWSEEIQEWPLPSIIGDYNKTIKDLTRLFEVRHILTHELPRDAVYDLSEIEVFLAVTHEFLDAASWVVVETLEGHVPRTQMAMNQRAGMKMNDLQSEMDSLLADIEQSGAVDGGALKKSQKAWSRYADREADLHASLVSGGSMYPMVWASAKSDITKSRIDALRWWITREEHDL